MKLSTVSDWLSWIDSLNTKTIDLGLERVRAIAKKLNVTPLANTVVTVAGTNAKGSTVTALESIYGAANYPVGTFTSPYLHRLNEEIRIEGKEVSDEDLINAFLQVEEVREGIALTSFEFITLAALHLLKEASLDVAILEVGLGGRLDAVNVIDADLAIVTNISLDHTEWLGSTREAIGFEKAGIFRANQLAVYGEENPPESLLMHAKSLNTKLVCYHKDFCFEEYGMTWTWKDKHTCIELLPYNNLLTQNMAVAVAAIQLLQSRLPVNVEKLAQGLKQAHIPGRIEFVSGPVTKILDVSHNPASVAMLAKRLKTISTQGKIIAVFSMLADKDINESIKQIMNIVNEWHIAPLAVNRAASLQSLQTIFHELKINNVYSHSTVREALKAAERNAAPDDYIVIFGSFHTVAETTLSS